MQLEHVVARFEAQAAAADGRTRIGGHGVTWGLLNDYNRVFVPGTFTESLLEIDARHPLPIGWMHEIPIGVWDDYREDDLGLWLAGLLSKTEKGNDTATLMRDGLNALSIGFRPSVIQWAEPGERCSFDTPFGTRAYQFDDYALYIVKADIVECSFVFVGADDEARIESVQALVRHARQKLPGVAAQASWEEAATSMARLLGGGLEDIPNLERQALYGSLAQAYTRHGKTPPTYSRTGSLAEISFQHGERALFAEQALREQFTAIAQTAPLLDGGLSADARAEAQETLLELQQLLEKKSEQQVFAEIEASLRETAQTLKEHTT